MSCHRPSQVQRGIAGSAADHKIIRVVDDVGIELILVERFRVRSRLFAGGKEIRTLGPPQDRRPFSPLRHSLFRRRDRLVLQEGPAVRIPFAPAGSLVRTWLSGAVRKLRQPPLSAFAAHVGLIPNLVVICLSIWICP
jgi:hypothetical protein